RHKMLKWNLRLFVIFTRLSLAVYWSNRRERSYLCHLLFLIIFVAVYIEALQFRLYCLASMPRNTPMCFPVKLDNQSFTKVYFLVSCHSAADLSPQLTPR